MGSKKVWTVLNFTRERLETETKDLWKAVKGSKANFSEIGQRVAGLITKVSKHTVQTPADMDTHTGIDTNYFVTPKPMQY